MTTRKKARIGIYTPMKVRGGAEKRAAALAQHLSLNYDVRLLVAQTLDVADVERFYNVDLSDVTVVCVGDVPHIAAYAGSGVGQKARALTARVQEFRAIQAQNLDLFINNAINSKMVCPARRGIFLCMFPHKPPPAAPAGSQNGLAGVRAAVARYGTGRAARSFETYDVITANSEYTADWIRRWWNCEATVVYSACEPIPFAAVKEKIILNVGRFGPDGILNNHKSQETLIAAFRNMAALHAADWSLHIAGSMAATNESQDAVRKLRERIAGFPIQIHENMPQADLHDLYGRASIYWHATGYGYPADEFPAKQEHFGMTVVEAMSARVVAIVLKAGGPRETVQHSVTGYHWEDIAELAEFTYTVAADAALRDRLGNAAEIASRRFSRTAFCERVATIVRGLLERE